MPRLTRDLIQIFSFFPLAALLLFGVTGCGSDPGYEHVYTVRGVVVSLPGEKATQEFIVHHETLGDYRSINGSVGMNEMAMPIPVPDRSVLEGIAVGDKIELTFGESFEPEHRMGVISVKKLADDTALFGRTPAKPQAAEDEGFISIFDGETLDGWEGDRDYWSVEDGTLVGEVTAEQPLKRNTFLIWRVDEVADFELKLEYRLAVGGNSGIQYRSQEIEGQPFAIKGYQADFEYGPRWTGQNYEEGGRGFLAMRGESVVLEAGEEPRVVEQIGDAAELNEKVHADDWNEYHLVVQGNRMIHYVNGVRMSEVLDNDEEEREMSGLLALQLHAGPPTKVEFRKVRLKVLD